MLSSEPPPERIAELQVDAVVVDVEVLGDRFWAWLEEMSCVCQNVPILVCTNASTVAERVRALQIGADDWLAKPCHTEELIARVEAAARVKRRVTRTSREPVLAGDLEINSDLFQAFVDGRSVNLTRREFEMLELLAAHEGSELRRDFIYKRLWGFEMIRGERSVDVFVRKIRQKLEVASPDWRYIHTHFSVGYSFAAVAMSTATERQSGVAA